MSPIRERGMGMEAGDSVERPQLNIASVKDVRLGCERLEDDSNDQVLVNVE